MRVVVPRSRERQPFGMQPDFFFLLEMGGAKVWLCAAHELKNTWCQDPSKVFSAA